MHLIYVLYQDGEPVYIGRAKGIYNLKQRLNHHRRYNKEFDEWEHKEVDSYEACKSIERKLIKQFKPKYNRQCIPERIRYM